MFQRRSQTGYSGIDSISEQHILTVLKFHEVRLGKIEKHLIAANKQLELLTMQKKQEPKKSEPVKVSTQTKSTNNMAEYTSFTLVKNMITNLTEQVEVSQSFMKELKEVVSNLKLNQENFFSRHCAHFGQIDTAVVQETNEEEMNEEDSNEEEMNEENTNEEMNEEDSNEEEMNEENTNEEMNEEINEEETNDILCPIVDDLVLENDIIKLANLKSHIEEEVQEVIGKIPVIIKPKKKRRGRPKKDIIA
ncbi:unnamed protein product [marine sediment metagenome]|uniref:Uncharacterized protein n=1 Tax=marine sediment metagenome TaxID=412755 RepID=X0SWV8_9ZZZZ